MAVVIALESPPLRSPLSLPEFPNPKLTGKIGQIEKKLNPEVKKNRCYVLLPNWSKWYQKKFACGTPLGYWKKIPLPNWPPSKVLYIIRKLATLGSWPLIFCSCLCCTKYQKNYIIGKLENRSTEWEYLKNENCPQINPMKKWFLIFRYHSTLTVFTICCLNMASFACAEL